MKEIKFQVINPFVGFISNSFKKSFAVFFFIFFATISYAQDTDGDGIINSIDVDDDNDGILDVDECASFVLEGNPLLENMIVKVASPMYSPGQTNQTTGSRMVFEMVDPSDLTTTIVVCRITVLSIIDNSNPVVIDWTVEDDSPRINLKVTGGSSSDVESAKLRFEFFDASEDIPNLLTGAAGTLPINVSFSYGIKDIDLSPEPRTESIAIEKSNLTGYTVDDPSTLTFSDTDIPGSLLFTGTVNNPSDIVKLYYFNQQTFEADIRSTHSDSGFIFNFSDSDPFTSPVETTLQCETDTDGDGIPDQLDIDSDNDGIPDNIEAQPTIGYIAPTGIDTDNDGLDDAYDTDDGGTPVPITNTDGIDSPDYIDTDSDNDGILDVNENGFPDIPLSGIDTDNDGLDNIFEGSNTNDGFDVNDEINNPQIDLPDTDEDVLTEDVNYRDDTEDPLPPAVLGNILWLRADKDVTGTTNVTAWNDQSGDDENASGAAITAPTLNSNSVNFNPAIRFNGIDDFMQITDGILENSLYNSIWAYSVIKSNATQDATVFYEKEDGGADALYMSVYNNQDRIRYRHAGNTRTADIGTFTNDIFSIQNFGANNDVTTPSGFPRAIYENGKLIKTGNSTSVENGNTSTMFLGSVDGSTGHFDGEVAEIMIFSDVPTALKQQQIQSYLAIKYGITLDFTDDNAEIIEGDYFLNDLTTKVWDYTANSTFHNDVAGIGRDDSMALNQKQSKSINSDAVITIGLTAIAENNEANTNTFPLNEDFLVWGNNNGDLGTTTDTTLLCAPEKTINRTWKITETGNINLVQLAVQRSTLDAVLNTPATVKVLKTADDEAFTINVHYIPITATTINGNEVYETKVNFFGTKFFTFSEINGIFWNGDLNAWTGGSAGDNSANTDADDLNKVMVIDSESSLNHAILNQNARIECVWIQGNSRLSVATDQFLEFDENFVLDGELRMIGTSQLLQTHAGESNVVGNGKIFLDQQALVSNVYRYHYWSSPVVELGTSTYRVGQVMKDGSIPISADALSGEAKEIIFTDEGYDGDFDPTNVSPITISNYWIWSYSNGTDGNNWVQKKSDGIINRGEGFTMKSTGRSPQGFTFTGTPNDGTITFSVDANTTSLLGNPYPSALNSESFITDNITLIENPDGDDAIDGTLYFWEHTGEAGTGTPTEGHNLGGYQGGYSIRNLSMGIAAITPVVGTDGLGGGTYSVPGRYIPIGQGFFVSSSTTGGTIRFENSQRSFQLEDGTNSLFLKSSISEDKISLLKIGLEHVDKYGSKLHRQLGISFIDKHSFEYDNGYDSELFDLFDTDFYWNFPEIDKKLAIAGVSKISDDLEIPLSIIVDTNNPITIKIDKKQAITDAHIYLTDKVLNKIYELSSDVILNLEKGTYNNRFYITFKKTLDINEESSNQKIKVFVDNSQNKIMINKDNSTILKELTLYNLIGQTVKKWSINNDLTNSFQFEEIPFGVYILKIKTSNNSTIKKKIIIK